MCNLICIRILPIERHHSGYIQPNEIDYYETYAPSKGYLAIELYSCSSNINFSYSKEDMNSFIGEDYDESVDISEKDYLVEMMSVDKGTLWIAIKGTSTTPAYYHITNHYYQQRKDIPFGKIVAGNDGHIKWHLDKSKSDSINIEFEHATCNKCNLDGVQINYHIFIAQDEKKLQMLGYCANEQYEEHQANDEKIFKKIIQSYRLADHNGSIIYEIDFPNLQTYEYASVGVVATVDNFMNSTSQMKVYYRTIQVLLASFINFIFIISYYQSFNYSNLFNHNIKFNNSQILFHNSNINTSAKLFCQILKPQQNTFYIFDIRSAFVISFIDSLVMLLYKTIQEYKIQGAKIIASSKLPQNDDAAFQNDFKMKYQTFEED